MTAEVPEVPALCTAAAFRRLIESGGTRRAAVAILPAPRASVAPVVHAARAGCAASASRLLCARARLEVFVHAIAAVTAAVVKSIVASTGIENVRSLACMCASRVAAAIALAKASALSAATHAALLTASGGRVAAVAVSAAAAKLSASKAALAAWMAALTTTH